MGWVTRGRFSQEPFGKGDPEQHVSGVSKTRTKQLVSWLCVSLTDTLKVILTSLCPLLVHEYYTASTSAAACPRSLC